MVTTDTIVALATPPGLSGIAVIRLNGPKALSATKHLCAAENIVNINLVPQHAGLHTVFINNKPLDDVIVTYFKKPHSYTGDDLIEISCHGNPVIVEEIIAKVCRHGLRIAEPGEFSLRAFLNGKIDLVQAESVAGLISAKSLTSGRLNYRLLKGRLSNRFTSLRDEIIDLLTEVEFDLDISEDVLNPNLAKHALEKIASLSADLENLLSTYRSGRLLNRGVNVVIVGSPNVGKSTLLNALVKNDRAIVSPTPGTTRDTIDITLVLEGVPINLIDTAGLHDTEDIIEREGIRRTRQSLDRADLILALYDISGESIISEYSLPPGVPVINIINKIDLLPDQTAKNDLNSIPQPLFISALNGQGVQKLEALIIDTLKLKIDYTSELLLTTARQHDIISRCKNSIIQAGILLDNANISFDLISIELRAAVSAIDELLGKTTAEDILNKIFGRFCVGK